MESSNEVTWTWLFGGLFAIVTTLAGLLWGTHERRLGVLEASDDDRRDETTKAINAAMEAFAKADQVNDTLMVEGVRGEIDGLRTLMMTMHEANVAAQAREAVQAKGAFDLIMLEIRSVRDKLP